MMLGTTNIKKCLIHITCFLSPFKSLIGLDSVHCKYKLSFMCVKVITRHAVRTLHTGPGGPSSLLYNGYRVPSPGYSGQGVTFTTHPIKR